MTLAKSIAHISSEMQSYHSLLSQINQIGHDIHSLRVQISDTHSSESQPDVDSSNLHYLTREAIAGPHKVGKLTRSV